jgi:hypothetical protein
MYIDEMSTTNKQTNKQTVSQYQCGLSSGKAGRGAGAFSGYQWGTATLRPSSA